MSLNPPSITASLDAGQSQTYAKTVDTSDVKLVVTPVVVSASPGLSVLFDPPSEAIFAGASTTFQETLAVGPAAQPGSSLTALVDFQFNGHSAGSRFRQKIFVSVPKHATTLVIQNASGLAGGTTTLSATLTDAVNGKPIAGAVITFKLGGTSPGAGVTNANGVASVSAQVPTTTGTYATGANFAGNESYLASEDQGTCIAYAYPANGSFVIGNGNTAVGSTAHFWDGEWTTDNKLSGGANTASFKGYATSTNTSGHWTGSPGGSSKPPSSVPSVLAVLVTSSATQSGSSISGPITGHVLLNVTSYDPELDKGGWGTVIGPI